MRAEESNIDGHNPTPTGPFPKLVQRVMLVRVPDCVKVEKSRSSAHSVLFWAKDWPLRDRVRSGVGSTSRSRKDQKVQNFGTLEYPNFIFGFQAFRLFFPGPNPILYG